MLVQNQEIFINDHKNWFNGKGYAIILLEFLQEPSIFMAYIFD